MEAAAALAQGVRTKRITSAREAEALQVLDRFWLDFYVVEPDDQLISSAAALASKRALRAYDAVHCATAEKVDERDLIFASGDRQQLRALAKPGATATSCNDGCCSD